MENTPTNLPSSDMLRIGVFALDIAWANPQANIDAVRRCLEQSGAEMDLLVLPELFTTAFSQDVDVLRELAEDDRGTTMTAMAALAHDHDTAIAGSYLAREGDAFYNRGFIALPDGRTSFYNKRHLFGLSAESRLFTGGSELPTIVEYKGWRLSMIVCYDLRFPVWCRRADGGCLYDVLVVPANWPVSRRYAWEHLLIARAIENQAVVVGADRSGHDDYGDYDGMTHVYDSTGHEVEAKTTGQLSIASVERSKLVELRRRWPVADDADTFNVDCGCDGAF